MRTCAILCVALAAMLLGCSSSVSPGQSPFKVATSLSAHHARLFVANALSHAITVYDENGFPLKTAGGFPGLGSPNGITYDAADQLVYVLDYSSNVCCSLIAYTTDGKRVASCSFTVPTAVGTVAFDPSNRLFYLPTFIINAENPELTGQGSVEVYDRTGSKHPTGGTFAMITDPTSIAVDAMNHRLYVASVNATGPPFGGLVSVFDEEGNQIGAEPGFFDDVSLPLGIAFDSANERLYVANDGLLTGGLKPVTVFDEAGDTSPTSGMFAAKDPFRIAFDPSNRLLYVASHFDNAIQAFDENGNPVSTPGGFPGLDYPTSLVVVP